MRIYARKKSTIGVTLLMLCSTSACRNEPASHEKLSDPRFAQVQDKLYNLALCIDRAELDGLQRAPYSEWEFLDDRAHREKLLRFAAKGWGVDRENPALLERVLESGDCLHFDVLMLYPFNDDVFTPEVVRLLRNGELQGDPFIMGAYLGYAATEDDFLLISAGPDMDYDVMGIVHRQGVGYWKDDPIDTVVSNAEIARLAKRIMPSEEDSPRRTSTFFKLDPNTIYDPTNGAVSNGDIVFHKRGGDNWMFSYPTTTLLTPKRLKKKPIAN